MKTNKNAVFTTLGASSHAKESREENDYYATEPRAVELLLELEKFSGKTWEPACGEGHLVKALMKDRAQYYIKSTDIINRGFPGMLYKEDFLKSKDKWDGDIITNPPYSHAQAFIEKALELVPKGNKVAMFLKLQFLEGKQRKQFFKKYPPKRIWVSSSRLKCAKNGDFSNMKKGKAVCYCWFIWVKGYGGKTTIKWFN